MSPGQHRMQEELTEQAAAWYVTQRQGELDGAAREQFVEWLRASPLHVAEYLVISGIGRDVPNAVRRSRLSREAIRHIGQPAAEVVRIDGAVPDKATAVANNGPRTRVHCPTLEHRRRRRLRLTGIAAAFAILAISAAALLVWRDGGRQFVTDHGEQRTWQLPDLSVVRLNSDTAVRVRFDGSKREVLLERGQAYFDVARDASRPFEVRTRSATLTALGTAFDVYQQDESTVITVIEGRVAVQPDRGGAAASRPDAGGSTSVPSVELGTGDQAHIRSSGQLARVSRADIPRATAWVRQEIAFDREPIAAVIAEFNRYNRMQLVVEDDRVAAIPVSGVFHSYDVQSFVDFLDQLPDVRVTSTAGRAVVTYGP